MVWPGLIGKNRGGSQSYCGAFIIPFIAHGAYDFLLMGNTPVMLTAFVPLVILYWITGFRRMKRLSVDSAFHNNLSDNQEPIRKGDLSRSYEYIFYRV